MKNKTTAALLAFFLGGLGIHQFYLRKPIKGVFYLLFCWTYIPSFIGIFDSVLLMAMSPEKFDKKYNLEHVKKEEDKLKNEQISNGLETFFNEYPNASENSLHFLKNTLPELSPPIDLINEEIQIFLDKQVSISGLSEQNEIKSYLENGLNYIPENFGKDFIHIYFLSLVEECLSDDALDPDEINFLTKKASEIGLEEYQSEESIRKAFAFYIKNWELDNGIFQEVKSDFIMNKNEICIYSNHHVDLFVQKEVSDRINYAGPRARIKITKGLSYNLGSYSYNTNKKIKEVSKGRGILNVTTKRILFKAPPKNITIRLSEIVDLEPHSNELRIYRSTGNPLIIKSNNVEEVYQSVHGVIRNLTT